MLSDFQESLHELRLLQSKGEELLPHGKELRRRIEFDSPILRRRLDQQLKGGGRRSDGPKPRGSAPGQYYSGSLASYLLLQLLFVILYSIWPIICYFTIDILFLRSPLQFFLKNNTYLQR